MFFRKAGKYLNMLYIFYFSFLIVLYFFLFKEYGFANEVYTLNSIFSTFKTISFLMPAIILLYFVEMVAVVKFLVNSYGKRESIGYYVFYVISSISGLLFYVFFLVIVYFPIKGFVARLKNVSLTEIPVLVAYSLIVILVLLLWKVVTYWKIKARLNYFGKYPGFKFLILPLNGFSFKDFFKFLLFVSFVVGLPLFIFIMGILNKNEMLVLISVFLSYLLFPFSRLYLYFLLMGSKES